MAAKSKQIPPMLLVTDDPLPRRSIAFYSVAELNGFVHSVLHAITQELVPSGALVFSGHRDYLRTKRVMADAEIARRAMALQLPQTAEAVERRNDNVRIERLLAMVNDAHLILSAMVPLLVALDHERMVGVEDGFAIRGNLLNTAGPLIHAIEAEFGADLVILRKQAKDRHSACGGQGDPELHAFAPTDQGRG